MKVERTVREFKYGAQILQDPDPAQSVEEVKTFYAGVYPELNNAEIEGPEHKGGKTVYEFRKAVGTKGHEGYDGQPGPQIGRLALRAEGDHWNAYYAPKETMQHAILLGSIRMSIVHEHAERKERFMDLMRDAVADIVEEATGIRPVWGDPERAPEHERAGQA